MVDVKYKRKFKNLITLESLRNEKKLADMVLLKKGNRLSIMPVSTAQWNHILSMST